MPPPIGTPFNDMRSQADSDRLFGEIKFWYENNRKQQHIGVIVEAKTDEDLYGGLFVRKNCVFFHSNGWSKAIPALQQANTQQLKGVICIIDADFRRIENEKPEIENLFMTDYHDAEMMMINSPAWEGVLNEYADNSIPSRGGLSKLDKFEQTHNQDIKTHLLEACKPVSCLILLSKKEKLSLEFKKFIRNKNKYKYPDYSKFIHPKKLICDVNDLINEIEHFSVRHNLFRNKPELRTKLDNLITTEFDLLELCNGHHFINIFVLALGEIGKNAQREDIETNLRTAYRLQDFQQTNLYNDLKNWQNAHTPPYHLLN